MVEVFLPALQWKGEGLVRVIPPTFFQIDGAFIDGEMRVDRILNRATNTVVWEREK